MALVSGLAGIAAWIAGAVGAGTSVAAVQTAKKIAVIAAALVAFGSLVATLGSAIDSGINSLASSVPGGVLSEGVALLPSVTGECLAAIVTAHAAAWVYSIGKNVLNFKVQV